MTAALSVQSLAVALGRNPILHEISLTLYSGTLATLVGPNGSGKSTLLASIAGLHTAQNGRVRIAGFDLTDQTHQARQNLGFMVAQDKLPGLLTPLQCLRLFANARGLASVPGATLGLAEQFGLSRWLDTLVSACSLGTRQKLSVLLALLDDPPLVVLDEPLNGLDPVSALRLKQHLKALTDDADCCVLMATHDLTMVETLSDHAIVILEGRVLLDWDRARLHQERSKPCSSIEAQIADALINHRANQA